MNLKNSFFLHIIVTGRSIQYKKNVDLTEIFLRGKNTSQIRQEQDLGEPPRIKPS